MTRHGYLDSIGNPHPQQPFSALNPFLPPQFACLRLAENTFHLYPTCTLSVLYRPPSLFNFHYLTSASLFLSQAGSWANTKVATPGTAFSTRTSRSRVENPVDPSIGLFPPVPPRSNSPLVSTATLSYMLCHGH